MKKRIVLSVGAVVAAAAIVAGVVYSRSEQPSTPAVADRVHIELRAMPPATIHVDGKNVGTTPLNLQFARSDREITIEATLQRRFVRRDGATKDEIYKGTRKVRLDRDHVYDFSVENTERVDTLENAPAQNQ